MNTAKHTPGAWSVEGGGARLINTKVHVISAADGLGPVAYSTTDNASLIAAAPELLAALKDCAAFLQRDLPLDGYVRAQPEIRAALAAIAKASGAKVSADQRPPDDELIGEWPDSLHRSLQPAEPLNPIPTAAEWLSTSGAAASKQWMAGWNDCRTHVLDGTFGAGESQTTEEQQ